MKCLSRSIQDKLADKFLKESDDASSDYKVTALGSQLDAMAKLLQLHPGSKSGKVKQKFKPVSYKAIEGIHMICPDVFRCETLSCKPHSLQQVTRICDIPLITLIKRFTIHDRCPVLAGKCTECNTMYYADHERASMMEGNQSQHSRVYLNSAQYLKVGQNLWVDWHFSNTVLSGIYHFHASASAYAEFWNDATWKLQPGNSRKIDRRQIWHTFVQESIWSWKMVLHWLRLQNKHFLFWVTRGSSELQTTITVQNALRNTKHKQTSCPYMILQRQLKWMRMDLSQGLKLKLKTARILQTCSQYSHLIQCKPQQMTMLM